MLLVERKSVAECLIVHHLKSAAGKAEYAQLCKGVKKLVEKYKKKTKTLGSSSEISTKSKTDVQLN